ncbi:hypothetical protein Tsubulata_002645 [Turnera subulata]|uniref:Legume lectin domain-containing protein n=1 Tax=Turnera subulata TaxID=218843 RepID=A0A9Q0G9J0_9ROSI|nr:hypothetical protein Tsubulata_002645 [Turnera subulata]
MLKRRRQGTKGTAAELTRNGEGAATNQAQVKASPHLPDLGIPLNIDGQYLGLTNSSIDNRPNNGIVAVELNSVKQGFDPDDNHLGPDLHSVNFTLTANLSSLDNQIAPPGGKNQRLWVHYSGPTKTLQVFMVDEDKPKPKAAAPALSALLDLSKHVKQRSHFGFASLDGA